MIITKGTRLGSGVTVKSEYIMPSPPPSLPLLFELDASIYASGSTWLDQSGNNRHATLNNVAWDAADGGSFVFTTDTSKFIYIPGSEGAWGQGGSAPNLTFSVWAKVISNGSYQHIAGWRGDINFWFLVLPNSQVEARIDTGSAYDIGMDYTPYYANWTYITFVADSTLDQTRLYLNSTLVGNYDTSLGTFGTGNALFRIGCDPNNSFAMSGNIGGAAAYSRALTQQEVTTEFNRTKTRYGL